MGSWFYIWDDLANPNNGFNLGQKTRCSRRTLTAKLLNNEFTKDFRRFKN